MKQVKRFASLLLVLLMTLVLALPGWAVESKPAESCTVYFGSRSIAMMANTPALAQPYTENLNAYQLLNLSTSQNSDGSYNYAYTVNEKYENILYQVSGKNNAKDLVSYLESMQNNSENIRSFADRVYRAIKTANDAVAEGEIEPYPADESVILTQGSGTLTNIAQGYWLFADVTEYTGKDNAVYSLVMVDTRGLESLTVQQKKDVPTVDKKIVENSNELSSNTASIGDTVNFKITGTVASQIGVYETYFYQFTDILSKGLTYNNDVKVTVDGENVTGQFTVDATTYSADNGTTITVSIADLKTLSGVSVTGNTKVVVEYSATLNENAVIGAEGNKNSVKLTYSNNPYGGGTGDTTPSETKTYTYRFQLVKTNNSNVLLDDATFKLYDAQTDGNEIQLVKESDGNYRVATIEEKTAGGFNPATIQAGNVYIKGLKTGTYWLDEISAPQGYNPVEGRTKVEIKSADLDATMDGNTWTAGGAHVINNTGSQLPTTGGMGTTIFYVLGGALMLGAVVLFITKKRMGQTEK